MSASTPSLRPPQSVRAIVSKVPEVSLYFWVIKVLCTTVGETFADWLTGKLGDSILRTTIVVGALLVVALVVQFRMRSYVPTVYWIAVVLISIVGTLITDNMTDNHGVPLTRSSMLFGALMLASFGAWFWSERTLSIHSIYTVRREAFYWVAILFTFALGTAAGDLIGEQYSLGYGLSVLLYAGIIAVIGLSYWKARLNAVFSFWAVYVLTRPLGASIGDLLSQPRKVVEEGGQPGLGLGTTVTSFIFLALILGVVVVMTRQQRQRPGMAVEAR